MIVRYPDHEIGYAVVGGQDTVINVFALDSSNKEEPEYTLIGHSDNVCALSVNPDDIIISGSWDKCVIHCSDIQILTVTSRRTAKVWKNFALQYDLKGHQQSVWSVLAINAKEFLTGKLHVNRLRSDFQYFHSVIASADKTIKYWVQHKAMRTYEGHRDAVRGLALVPHVGFASCSNDRFVSAAEGQKISHSISAKSECGQSEETLFIRYQDTRHLCTACLFYRTVI